jgi:ferredoxin-NADP reductase
MTQHTKDLFTLILKPERKTPRFKAGQFLHLALDPYDPSAHWPESRAFSIANSPARLNELRIVFSVKGAFTRRMAAHIQRGSEVWLKMPYGSFYVMSEADSDTVLIAGGTGITPFASFLEQACDLGTRGGIMLFYGARSRRHLVFEQTVRECTTRLSDFKAWIFSESAEGMDGLDYRKGQLSFDIIWHLLPRPMASTYYLSGPPEMLESFSAKLAASGVFSKKIRTDDWE